MNGWMRRDKKEERGMEKGARSGRSMGYNGRMEERDLCVSRNQASVYSTAQMNIFSTTDWTMTGDI